MAACMAGQGLSEQLGHGTEAHRCRLPSEVCETEYNVAKPLPAELTSRQHAWHQDKCRAAVATQMHAV